MFLHYFSYANSTNSTAISLWLKIKDLYIAQQIKHLRKAGK